MSKRTKNTSIKNKISSARGGLVDDSLAIRNGGLPAMKERLLLLKQYLSDPNRQTSDAIRSFVNRAVVQYERAAKASIGMPTYADSVTRQFEAPKDIPTVPLDGYQLVQRTCAVEKLASLGATAGGFFAQLSSNDLAPFVGSTSKFYRIKKVTSWTVPRADGNLTQGTFAGVAVPQGVPGGGSSVTPIWSENWTPVGQGFAGVVTQYPLGDFPQYQADASPNNLVLNHYTALGGTGGVINVPVVFHVVIECLI